jgi:hypothetical protein
MSPTLAMVFSLLFPGLGQFYNRQTNRAIGFFVSLIAVSILYPPLGIAISFVAAWDALVQARRLMETGYQSPNLRGALLVLGVTFITGLLAGLFGSSVITVFQ